MADRVIRIIVDTSDGNRQLLQLEDNLEGVEKQEKRTQSSTAALGQAFRSLLGFIAIREIAKAADTFTLAANRIRLVTDSTQELNAVQDELFAVATRTRSSFESTVELYARVARSTDALGASQAEVLKFTEAINQSIQISGATAQEAAASTIQFAQGLASGALRGDELRSVLEQNSRLAQVLADEFETDIGGLRKLGEAGQLTADRVFGAVLKGAEQLNEEFSTVTPTIAQTFTTIGNFGTLVVGSFNEAAGVTEGLTEIFGLNEDQAKELGIAVRDLGLDFREFVEVAVVAIANFVETVAPKFQVVRAEIVKIIAALTRDEALFLAALEGQDEFNVEIEKIKSKLDAEFDAIRRNNEERRKGLEERDADLTKPGSGGGRTAAVEITAEQQKLLDQQQQIVKGLQEQVAAQVIANQTGREYAEVLAEIKINQLATANGNTEFGESARGLAENLRLAKLESEELADAQKALIEDQERAAQLFEDTRTATERYAIALAELQDLFDRGLIDQEVFDRAKKDLDELGKATDDFFRRARENSQDILADFFAGGFDSLDDFARAFGEMLLQLTSQALAANIFDAILGPQGGGGGGGFGSFLSGVFGGRQFGGGVQGGQAVNTGEGGRFGSEVFVPNVGGTVVPINGNRGGQSMPAPQVNTTIVNTIDSSEIVGAFNEGAGDTVLLNRITTKRQAFRRALGV